MNIKNLLQAHDPRPDQRGKVPPPRPWPNPPSPSPNSI